MKYLSIRKGLPFPKVTEGHCHTETLCSVDLDGASRVRRTNIDTSTNDLLLDDHWAQNSIHDAYPPFAVSKCADL